jgi:hypothetical protein
VKPNLWGTIILLIGIYLLWCGIKGYDPVRTLQRIVTGQGTSGVNLGQTNQKGDIWDFQIPGTGGGTTPTNPPAGGSGPVVSL